MSTYDVVQLARYIGTVDSAWENCTSADIARLAKAVIDLDRALRESVATHKADLRMMHDVTHQRDGYKSALKNAIDLIDARPMPWDGEWVNQRWGVRVEGLRELLEDPHE